MNLNQKHSFLSCKTCKILITVVIEELQKPTAQVNEVEHYIF